MLKHLAVIAFLMIAASSVSCTQARRLDQCDRAMNPCDDAGALQCSPTLEAIEVCETNEDGCLVWMEQEACESGDECDLSAATPRCACVPGCDTPSASRCRGAIVELCIQTSPTACRDWVPEVDCDEVGMECDDSSGDALCIGECANECEAAGSSWCSGSEIVECVVGDEGCLQLEFGADCAEMGEFCVSYGDTAVCESECADECEGEGLTRCDGDTLLICDHSPAGCLVWGMLEDCGAEGLPCLEDPAGAHCGCVDECALGESRCAGDVIEICGPDPFGCSTWVEDFDCGSLGLGCDDSVDVPVCESGSGDSCDEARILWEFPFVARGSSFADDFDDNLTFTHDSCESRSDSPEAIFAVDLEAGATVRFREEGDVNVTFSVQQDCNPAGACELSEDRGERWGFEYVVEDAGRYYLIIEAFEDEAGSYEIYLEVIYPEDCSDGVDNDLDSAIDCDDEDCFGHRPDCSTETNCRDGRDNDLDGAADCDDDDCDASAWCEPYHGVWERFEEGDLPDVAGHSIVFTRDPALGEGYDWLQTAGTTEYTVEPGSGRSTRELEMRDDDSTEYSFELMGPVPFFDETYTSFFVGSNGYVSFGEGSASYAVDLEAFFEFPAISGFRRDLDPSRGGTITIDELADRVAVTFDGVPRYGASDPGSVPNDFQIVLHEDGTIELHYLTLNANNALIGLGNGVGADRYPHETDFVDPLPEDCEDGLDNDFDGRVDCADTDCIGDERYCSSEDDCSDGIDNDGDGDVDCADSDCEASFDCIDCDATDGAACGDDAACYLDYGEDGSTYQGFCFAPEGDAEYGDECEETTDCAEGMYCSGSRGTCNHVCRREAPDCPPRSDGRPRSCNRFPGSGWRSPYGWCDW